MTAGLRQASLRAARPHCTCVEVRNYDYAAAAAKLGCHERWLKDRIRKIAHQKIGYAVVFCDCDLRLIQAMCTVLPDDIRRELSAEEADEPQETPAATGRPSLYDVRPAGARRRKTDATP